MTTPHQQRRRIRTLTAAAVALAVVLIGLIVAVITLQRTGDTASEAAPGNSTSQDATEAHRISPVTDDWLPRDGWTITTTTETMQGDCSPSPVALDEGIYTCGASALSANACSHNPDNGVSYCPLSPFEPEFRPYYFLGEINDAPVARDPQPRRLKIDDAANAPSAKTGAWG